MKKGLIILVLLLFGSISSVALSENNPNQIDRENGNLEAIKVLSGEITDMESNNTENTYLKLEKRPFDTKLIGFYIGKARSSQINVPDGIYVAGVKGHSGLQGITIYSRDMTANTHIIKARVKGNILEIYVDQTNNNSHNEQHMVYQTQTSETPEKYVVYKNGKLEKTKQITSSIE